MSTPPDAPRTLLGALSQMFDRAKTSLDFSQMELRKGARLPSIEVLNPDPAPNGPSNGPLKSFPLAGDRYLLGRSSRCDIVVANSLVSQEHLSLNRSRRQAKAKHQTFEVRDEGSTNGVFWKKKRYKSLELRHNDVISLGPPELANTVQLRYVDPPPLWQVLLRYGAIGTGSLTLLALILIGVEWTKFSVKLLGNVRGPIVAYAGDGTPLQTLRSKTHAELPDLKDFSPYLPKALVASEDSRFYWHLGIDPVRVLSALAINLKSGSIQEGASTVTQQIARSLYPEYVGKDDSNGRKIREMIVALKLEMFYSKDFLLKTYLNRVYLGVGYGFEDTAQRYFRKSARELSLSEAATLVGMLPAPNRFNPCDDRETSVGLRNRVIKRMAAAGVVSPTEANEALRSAINIDPQVCQDKSAILSPYFYSRILDEMETILGQDAVQQGNFIVETSLDLKLQQEAEKSLKASIRGNGSTYNYDQGAVITLDAKSGSVLALVGGYDYQESQFNRATQAMRQPGSTFKVFAYAAALEKGISPDTPVSCAPLDWEGQSYAGCVNASGAINLYNAVAQSENPVALRVAQDVGLDGVIAMAQKLGVKSELRSTPGLILGQSEVTPLEMAGAYSVFANGGRRNQPHALNRIFDSNTCTNPDDRTTCRVVYDYAKDAIGRNEQAISPEIASTMTRLLQGPINSGTARSAYIGQGEAGKTGTTNDGIDLWFVGYIPNRALVTSVWLGNDNNDPTSGSSALAAELWGNYMGAVTR